MILGLRRASSRKASRKFLRHASTEINGDGKTAVLFGGFGFTKRAMAKHAALYSEHGFDVVPILSDIKDLTTPSTGEIRGRAIAEQIVGLNQETVCHFISGSFWTGLYMFKHMDLINPGWKDKHVKGIVFDSCPPKSDTLAFGGFVAFRFNNPALQTLTAPLSEPYRMLCGINSQWEAENERRMFGEGALIPRGAHQLHIHGKTDPVLNPDYLKRFVRDCRQHKTEGTSIIEATFEKSKHSMAVVEHPKDYKQLHISELLGKVTEWRVGEGEIETPYGADFQLHST
jgi:hypothetical protein